ncbi:hypothetical protein BJV78DRAFT_1211749 [Lactifluus subvellereus]|nr:hypothetical protein BJV78DRAFT_1211749 [Lactifluus subvellereus]
MLRTVLAPARLHIRSKRRSRAFSTLQACTRLIPWTPPPRSFCANLVCDLCPVKRFAHDVVAPKVRETDENEYNTVIHAWALFSNCCKCPM